MPYLNNYKSSCGGLGPWGFGGFHGKGGCCKFRGSYGDNGSYGDEFCNDGYSAYRVNRRFFRNIGGNHYGITHPQNDYGSYNNFVMHSIRCR